MKPLIQHHPRHLASADFNGRWRQEIFPSQFETTAGRSQINKLKLDFRSNSISDRIFEDLPPKRSIFFPVYFLLPFNFPASVFENFEDVNRPDADCQIAKRPMIIRLLGSHIQPNRFDDRARWLQTKNK